MTIHSPQARGLGQRKVLIFMKLGLLEVIKSSRNIMTVHSPPSTRLGTRRSVLYIWSPVCWALSVQGITPKGGRHTLCVWRGLGFAGFSSFFAFRNSPMAATCHDPTALFHSIVLDTLPEATFVPLKACLAFRPFFISSLLSSASLLVPVSSVPVVRSSEDFSLFLSQVLLDFYPFSIFHLFLRL
jgi:hypothetical protein